MLTAFLLTVALFFAFVLLLIYGIIRRKRKPVYTSLIFFLLTVGAGIYTTLLLAGRTYDKIKTADFTNPFARSGIQIYTSLFGEPQTNCVQVLNKTDQAIPRLDCCIWLEFTTCPAELARIIASQHFKAPMTAPQDSSRVYVPDYSPRPDWFQPDSLGEGVQALQDFDPNHPNRDHHLYFSADSTHAFYLDMLD